MAEYSPQASIRLVFVCELRELICILRVQGMGMRIDDLEFHVLVCLAVCRTWKHGYAIRQWLCQHRKIDPTFQAVYRVIDRLHDRGLVDLKTGGFTESLAGLPRKNYLLNEAGYRELETQVTEMSQVAARIEMSVQEFSKLNFTWRQAQ